MKRRSCITSIAAVGASTLAFCTTRELWATENDATAHNLKCVKLYEIDEDVIGMQVFAGKLVIVTKSKLYAITQQEFERMFAERRA